MKTKDFKSLDELQSSLKEFDSVIKDADSKYKEIQTANNELNQDLQNSNNYQNIIEKDSLENELLDDGYTSISRIIINEVRKPKGKKAKEAG